MCKRLLLIVPAIILYSLSSGSIVLAAPSVGKVNMLPPFKGMPFRPQISGDWILAPQLKEMSYSSGVAAVNAYNVKTGDIWTAFEGKCGWPQVGGGYALWSADRKVIDQYLSSIDASVPAGVSNLVLLDLSTWRYSVPPLGRGTAYQYSVHGDCVAWTGVGQGQVCSLIGGKAQTISSEGANFLPSVGPGLIVWQDDKDGHCIKGYVIKTGKVFTVVDEPGVRHENPDTDGKTVVWTQDKPQSIWTYDLSTGKRAKVAEGFDPCVDNDILVYRKLVGGKYIVFGKLLSTSEEFQISTGASNSPPRVDGHRVVWANSNRIFWTQLDLGMQKP